MTRSHRLALRGVIVAATLTLAGCQNDPNTPTADASVRLGTRTFGDPCSTNSDCATGLCVRVDATHAVCTRVCSSDAECPGGRNWGCVAPENWDRSICGCASEGDSEVCGDGLDNECNGQVDDCRECFGEPVGETDPRHCGECGNACGAEESCVDGECQCTDSALTQCGSACVDTASDARHCGGCETSCDVTQVCEGGSCVCPEWAPDECDGRCVDFQDEPESCGSCGNRCQDGLICRIGECTCPDANQSWCEGIGCVDLRSDASNCGECGTTCGAGQTCVSSACSCGTSGQSICDDACVSTSTDPQNCGACGQECHPAEACVSGACQCPLRRDLCGDACVDTAFDESHCGTCGNACAPGETCSAGTCTCPSGVYCGDTCMPSRDPLNCGGCGVVCAPDQTCGSSGCECVDSTATWCGSSCVRTYSDTANCGACGNVCASHLTCRSSACACPTIGHTDCGSLAGCVNLVSDPANCGGCGTVCNPGEICSSGTCQCPLSGHQWCASTGACVDVRSDEAHCGGCDAACRPGETCSYGTCRCPSGQTWCASVGGCVATSTDPSHCGACDNTCRADQVCTYGSCRCATGSLFCASQGICTDVQANEEHCGACDNACPPESQCTGGACECFLTTETACPDRCTNLQTDVSNCGACGNTCSGARGCIDGECRCPPPVLGAQLEPGTWDNEGRVAWASLPDGRTALLISDRTWASQAALVYIVNADGTPSAGPFDVQRFSTADHSVHALDLVWDGTALGALYSRVSRLSQLGEAYFARIDLLGTVVSSPVRVDDDRPSGRMLEAAIGKGTRDGPRLVYDPSAGYTALSVDYRPVGVSSYGAYSRHLGQTGASRGASRLLVNPSTLDERTRVHRLDPTGDIDFFVPVSDSSTIVLRLNAQGAPRAPSLSLPHDLPRVHMPRGVLEGSAGPELLFGPSGNFYPGPEPRAYWYHGMDYSSVSPQVSSLNLDEDSVVIDGPTGPLHHAVSCCGELEIQRIEQLGPGNWAPIEPPLSARPNSRNYYQVVPTGPLNALYTNGHYLYPIQFSDCQ